MFNSSRNMSSREEFQHFVQGLYTRMDHTEFGQTRSMPRSNVDGSVPAMAPAPVMGHRGPGSVYSDAPSVKSVPATEPATEPAPVVLETPDGMPTVEPDLPAPVSPSALAPAPPLADSRDG